MSKNLKLQIQDYTYTMRCDVYRCSNLAKHSIGYHGEPKGMQISLCTECLQDIVSEAPLEMVLKRKDVQEHVNIEVEKRVAEKTETEPKLEEKEPEQPTPPKVEKKSEKPNKKAGAK